MIVSWAGVTCCVDPIMPNEDARISRKMCNSFFGITSYIND
jgi:hypothetical protein